MILCRCWRVIRTRKKLIKIQGELKMVPNFRFPSDHDFGFDITRPANWQKFLENYKLDGLLLPRKTVEGHYIVYQVYDTSSKMKDGGRNRSLFPGYREDGTKLDVWKYGYLK